MTKTLPSPKRNVERIRQKNLEDNQLFLEKLLMTNIRNDFVNSARSILRKDGNDQVKKHIHQKVERSTRYNEKVKSGEIAPHIPEWQRLIEEKKKEAEKKLLEKERRRLEIEQKKKEAEKKLLEKERRRLEIEQKKKEAEKKLLEKERRRLEIEQKKQEYERMKKELLLEKERKKQENERKRREEYQRKREEFLLEKELRKIEKELKIEERIRIRLLKRRPPKPTKWTVFRKNCPRPYQRSFKPRHTKVGERAEQSLFNLNMSSQ